jgi:hypothetical protein
MAWLYKQSLRDAIGLTSLLMRNFTAIITAVLLAGGGPLAAQPAPNAHKAVTPPSAPVAKAPVYNCDLPQLFEEITAAIANMSPRTQFESTNDFTARLGRTVAAKLGNRARNLTCEIAAQTLTGSRPYYDPNDKIVKFPDLEGGLLGGGHGALVHLNEQQLESYTASNAFGVERKVEAKQFNYLGLKWSIITDPSTQPKFSMAAREAEAQWNDLSLAVIGDLEVPYLTFDEQFIGPTLDRPTAVIYKFRYLVMRPSRLVFWNKATGKVLKEWKMVSCNAFTVWAYGECLGGANSGTGNCSTGILTYAC